MALRKTTATIRPDSPRHVAWVEIFGTDTVPLEGPLSHILSGDGFNEHFYMLDVMSLSDEMRDRIVNYVSRAFGIAEEIVRARIEKGQGVPILAKDVIVAIDARHVL